MRHIPQLLFLLCFAVHGVLAGAAEPSRMLVAGGQDKSARIAVVIGNSGYPSGALANPKNDATAMAASLKKLGFDVELKLDATKADMDAVFKRFSAKAEKAGVAALFYAGHGIQVGGGNYIVPIDAKPQNERDLKREMVKMDDIIDDMGAARVKLVFFDACRDNPLSRSFSRGGARGMAAPVEATGTLISFATKHGNTAADGDGMHSPYTTALLDALENASGVEIEQMLRRVQQGVRQATNGQQEPWRYGSLDGDFYFKAPAPQVEAGKFQQEAVDRAIQEAVKRASDQATAEALRRASEQQASSSTTVELSFWDSIKNSASADDFKEYLTSYPQGRFAGLARNRIRTLEAISAQAARTTPVVALAAAAVVPAAVPAVPAVASAPPVVQQASAALPPASAPAPMRLAMIAPSKPALSPVPPSIFPQAGDSWTYRYINGWKRDSPQTVVVGVEESEGERVTDKMSLKGGRGVRGGDERSYEARIEATERPLGGDVRVIELLPYAQVLLKDGLVQGQEKSLPNISLGGLEYRLSAKHLGQEAVTLPAGNFQAAKLEILGQRLGSGPLRSAIAFTHTVWFVAEVRRVVKVVHKSHDLARSPVDDDSLELVAHTASDRSLLEAVTAPEAASAPKPAVDVSTALPRVGDSWTYRYIDAWKKGSPQTVVVKVEESEAGRVSDRMSLRGGRGDERSHESKPEGAERSLGRDVRVIELLPYAQSLLPDGLKAGQEKDFPDLTLGGQAYRIKARLIGQARINVPAGSFDAIRVEIVGLRVGGLLTPSQQSVVANVFTHTLWFAPEIRRVVKVEHKSDNQAGRRVEDDTLELVSYSLR